MSPPALPTRSILLNRRGFNTTLVAAGLLPRFASAASVPPVVITSDEDVTTLDPHLIRNNHPIGSVIWSLFDSLVRRRPDGTHEPRLATGWAQVLPTVWHFTLRSGVTFHNGETLDAAGVVFNLHRMNQAPWNGECQLWQQSGLVVAQALDAATVALTTAAPSSTLLYWLEEAFIGPAAYLRDTPPEQVGSNPVGSGPYRFVSWQRGSQVSLRSNAGYWGGAPPIRDVVFRAVPELSARLDELKGGSIDLLTGLDPDSAALAVSPVSGVRQVRGLRKMHMGIAQHGIAPLRDRLVRQALNHAVDVQLMVDTLQRGTTTRLLSIINPPHNDPALKPFAYDPVRARTLLKQSNHEGFTVELAFDGRYADAQETCEAVGSFLEAVGLRPVLKAYESGHFTETLRARGFPGLYFHGFAAQIEPLVELIVFTSSAVDNASGYDSPAVDAVMKQASEATDDDSRAALVRRAEGMIWNDAPWIYLWYLPALYGSSHRLDYLPRPDDYIEIYRARLTA
ncbi:hypothetical protein HN018_03520 [Lichenicola cladoniae]|uniref:Solute-binding protein family 5 domain-containing protein n=1 Tax=Lichenicola cladoniae TaxID=1484109 RepID=A0A6M8HLK8_9PROT|nr:ABC transporter substrate-binding protein [Lichenicola cladoniae]QKE89231.1 hypothetical protein HN018_03520 [Lichenicola cladoniae]